MESSKENEYNTKKQLLQDSENAEVLSKVYDWSVQ
jgi:hypothetical protein